MKIQIDLPKDLNKKLKIDKIKLELTTIQETLIENLTKYYKIIESQMFDKKGNLIIFGELK